MGVKNPVYTIHEMIEPIENHSQLQLMSDRLGYSGSIQVHADFARHADNHCSGMSRIMVGKLLLAAHVVREAEEKNKYGESEVVSFEKLRAEIDRLRLAVVALDSVLFPFSGQPVPEVEYMRDQLVKCLADFMEHRGWAGTFAENLKFIDEAVERAGAKNGGR